jgi:hypothetical protein
VQRSATTPSDNTKKGVVAHPKHQSASKTRRWAAAEGKPKVLDDIIEPASTPSPRRQNTILAALREDVPSAQISTATETARHDDEADWPTSQGQVGDASEIATVDPLRTRPASRTPARSARTVHGDHRGRSVIGGVLHHKPVRDQGGGSEGLLHGVDSL